MADLNELSEPAVKDLLAMSEDTLYEKLAMRVESIKEEPLEAGKFDAREVDPSKHAGWAGDLLSLGMRIFNRWNREAHALICGSDPEDDEQRTEVSKAFDADDVNVAVAACISGLLVTTFGLAPAIAAVVAAIIVKRFLKGAYEEFCDVWKTNLPASV